MKVRTFKKYGEILRITARFNQSEQQFYLDLRLYKPRGLFKSDELLREATVPATQELIQFIRKTKQPVNEPVRLILSVLPAVDAYVKKMNLPHICQKNASEIVYIIFRSPQSTMFIFDNQGKLVTIKEEKLSEQEMMLLIRGDFGLTCIAERLPLIRDKASQQPLPCIQTVRFAATWNRCDDNFGMRTVKFYSDEEQNTLYLELSDKNPSSKKDYKGKIGFVRFSTTKQLTSSIRTLKVRKGYIRKPLGYNLYIDGCGTSSPQHIAEALMEVLEQNYKPTYSEKNKGSWHGYQGFYDGKSCEYNIFWAFTSSADSQLFFMKKGIHITEARDDFPLTLDDLKNLEALSSEIHKIPNLDSLIEIIKVARTSGVEVAKRKCDPGYYAMLDKQEAERQRIMASPRTYGSNIRIKDDSYAYSIDVYKGSYTGEVKLGEPDGYGCFEDNYSREYGHWQAGEYHGIIAKVSDINSGSFTLYLYNRNKMVKEHRFSSIGTSAIRKVLEDISKLPRDNYEADVRYYSAIEPRLQSDQTQQERIASAKQHAEAVEYIGQQMAQASARKALKREWKGRVQEADDELTRKSLDNSYTREEVREAERKVDKTRDNADRALHKFDLNHS